jgi:hypothetical protein
MDVLSFGIVGSDAPRAAPAVVFARSGARLR